jgi:peptide/nickel transport system permease protein
VTVDVTREHQRASTIEGWSSSRAGTMHNLRRQARRFARNRLAVAGLVIVLFLLLIAAIGPYIAPYPEDAEGALHISERLQGPSRDHLMGTDDVGADIFSRVLIGTRLSLGVGGIVILLAVLIGIPLGALAGYFGGIVNEIIMRITDIFLTIPGLILALAIAAALGPSIRNAMIALSIVWWPGYCRLTQAQFLSLRQDVYVEAARTIGARDGRIIFRHILPNTLTPMLVKISMDLGFAILTAAGLSFIGVGAQPPTPEWGAMVSLGRKYMPEWWWYSAFPGGAIFIAVFAFNMLGDGLRDMLDPRGSSR